MSQTTDAVIAELMDRRLLNDVDDGLHQEIAEAVIKAAQPAVDEDGPLSTRDLAMIDQAWENYKAALPVATVINDNQPGRTAIIEITIDPPTLPVGTKLYAGPKMVELAAETSPGDVVDVKAEAKSQEPVAVAWRRRRKGIVGNGGWIMCPEYPGRDREFDLEHLYTHPTKPEAPAVSVDAIKVWRDIQSTIEQAIDCIRGETPEDCSDEEARADTLSKLRDADDAIAALIAGGR